MFNNGLNHHWPDPPTGPKLSTRDVGLLDLARHCSMQAGIPLGTIKADADELWGELKARAGDLKVDLDRDAVLDALEPGAHEWAEQRAIARRIAAT